MGDLSEHFSRWEFESHDGASDFIPPPVELLAVLERIRAIRGTAMLIVSGYRSAAQNAKVGGAPNSRHRHGDAADILPHRCTVPQAKAAGAHGIGYDATTGWVVHVDMRPLEPVVFAERR